MESWIKLYRKFDEWEWFDNSEMVHLFIFLLLNVNNENGQWKGIKIDRGQIITGLNSLNKKTNISLRKLRTCLNRLKLSGEIDIQTTNKFSIITICKYDTYQYKYDATDKQDNKRSTSNRQATDHKQEKKEIKINKEENLQKRSIDFKNSIASYSSIYSEAMLDAFFNYWSESTKDKKNMRFELESTFEISKRLITWNNRNNQFKKNDRYKTSSQRDEKRINTMWDQKV